MTSLKNKTTTRTGWALAVAGLAGFSVGCGDDGDTSAETGTYQFSSRFGDLPAMVYTGQTTRQFLVQSLKAEMSRISDGITGGTLPLVSADPVQEIRDVVMPLFEGKLSSPAIVARTLPTYAEGNQCFNTYAELKADAYPTSDGPSLLSKVAGRDTATDHKTWEGDASLGLPPQWVGWSDATNLILPPADKPQTVLHPAGLVYAFLETFAQQAAACAVDPINGCPRDPAGNPLPLYVTPTGLDLQQLVEKTLRTGIFFSQMADDYLDDQVEDSGKGLLADNTAPRDGSGDTALEHAWDEGFGYFGASVDLNTYDDGLLTGAGFQNVEGSESCINPFREKNFFIAVNAGKRDAGSDGATTFAKTAFDAFVAGRRLITDAGGALDETQMAALKVQRDLAISTVEKVYAATVLRYVNLTAADLASCGTPAYSFADHAKHWAEMKAFAFAFQYNRLSPFNTGGFDFAQLHAAMGDAPVLCSGDVTSYNANLEAVRTVLAQAYGFDPALAASW